MFFLDFSLFYFNLFFEDLRGSHGLEWHDRQSQAGPKRCQQEVGARGLLPLINLMINLLIIIIKGGSAESEMVLILLVFTGIGPELVHTGRIEAQIIFMILE